VIELLVVEDEPGMRGWLRRAFEGEGHAVTTAEDAKQAIALAASGRFDLILLDVELGPGLDGFQVCQALRAGDARVPIIMLTGLQSEADTVRGLEAGADDYVTKPFRFGELNSRIRAVLRRTAAKAETSVRAFGPLRMDLLRRETTVDGRVVPLTFSEFQLLGALLEQPGAPRSREALMTAIWGDSAHRDLRGIDVHVRHLREKLGAGTIQTVRGQGYRVQDGSPSS
jgi:DNA-binding response OmpR family regulator